MAFKLVPAMTPRAKRAMILSWAVIVLAIMLVLGMPSGHPLLVAVIAGLLLIELGVLGSGLRVGAIALGIFALKYLSAPALAALKAFALGPAGVALGLIVLLYNGHAALQRQFGVARLLGATKAKTRSSTNREEAAYGPIMRWVWQDARPQPLFMQPLGASALGNSNGLVFVPLVLCCAVRGWHAWRGDVGAEQGLAMLRGFFVIALLMFQALLVNTEATRFQTRRVEQALLRLTPAAPAAGLMNAVLIRLCLSRFARMWLKCSAAILLGTLLLGASMPELARLSVACLLPLLLAGGLMRDHARGRSSGMLHLALFAVYSFFACGVAAMAMIDERSAQAWPQFAALLIVAGILFAWLRRRRMLGAPPALPAMRFA